MNNDIQIMLMDFSLTKTQMVKLFVAFHVLHKET